MFLFKLVIDLCSAQVGVWWCGTNWGSTHCLDIWVAPGGSNTKLLVCSQCFTGTVWITHLKLEWNKKYWWNLKSIIWHILVKSYETIGTWHNFTAPHLLHLKFFGQDLANDKTSLQQLEVWWCSVFSFKLRKKDSLPHPVDPSGHAKSHGTKMTSLKHC